MILDHACVSQNDSMTIRYNIGRGPGQSIHFCYGDKKKINNLTETVTPAMVKTPPAIQSLLFLILVDT